MQRDPGARIEYIRDLPDSRAALTAFTSVGKFVTETPENIFLIICSPVEWFRGFFWLSPALRAGFTIMAEAIGALALRRVRVNSGGAKAPKTMCPTILPSPKGWANEKNRLPREERTLCSVDRGETRFR